MKSRRTPNGRRFIVTASAAAAGLICLYVAQRSGDFYVDVRPEPEVQRESGGPGASVNSVRQLDLFHGGAHRAAAGSERRGAFASNVLERATDTHDVDHQIRERLSHPATDATDEPVAVALRADVAGGRPPLRGLPGQPRSALIRGGATTSQSGEALDSKPLPGDIQSRDRITAKTDGGNSSSPEKVNQKAAGEPATTADHSAKTDGSQTTDRTASKPATDAPGSSSDKANVKTDTGSAATDKSASANPAPAASDPSTHADDTSPPTTAKSDAPQNDTLSSDTIITKSVDFEMDSHSRIRHNGDAFLFASSTVSTGIDLPAAAQSISIFAHGDKGGGEWPRIQVSVDGVPMGEVVVNSTTDKKFYLPIYADPGHSTIQLSFVNDFYDATTHQDRNVYIRQIKVHTQPH